MKTQWWLKHKIYTEYPNTALVDDIHDRKWILKV
jgi:hypothetical protein